MNQNKFLVNKQEFKEWYDCFAKRTFIIFLHDERANSISNHKKTLILNFVAVTLSMRYTYTILYFGAHLIEILTKYNADNDNLLKIFNERTKEISSFWSSFLSMEFLKPFLLCFYNKKTASKTPCLKNRLRDELQKTELEDSIRVWEDNFISHMLEATCFTRKEKKFICDIIKEIEDDSELKAILT